MPLADTVRRRAVIGCGLGLAEPHRTRMPGRGSDAWRARRPPLTHRCVNRDAPVRQSRCQLSPLCAAADAAQKKGGAKAAGAPASAVLPPRDSAALTGVAAAGIGGGEGLVFVGGELAVLVGVGLVEHLAQRRHRGDLGFR